VVFVDTDAPVLSQLAADATLSADATIDTLRVDVIVGETSLAASQIFVVPEVSSWPVSFAVVGPKFPVRLRLRGFRAELAEREQIGDSSLLAAPPEIAIDRLIELAQPTKLESIAVTLAGDCLGAPASFLGAGNTCIDGARRDALPREAIDISAEEHGTRAGTWQAARRAPCTRTSPPGARCIPGGFTLLGDAGLAGLDHTLHLSPIPYRPARIRPFHLDRTEVTVGRFRSLVVAGKIDSSDLPVSAQTEPFCTWLGAADAKNDDLPLNCVSSKLAESVCTLFGGTLASEARWEHAARGRGARLPYPWGRDHPACCTASIERGRLAFKPMCAASATQVGVEPAGSHPIKPGCAGGGDETSEGVLDLGGSLSELTADRLADFDAPCWRYRGVAIDPRCDDANVTARVLRGGSWASHFHFARGGIRSSYAGLEVIGFRCAYSDAP
jgi:formylglycine-generating enzyme required for sulfatase activity